MNPIYALLRPHTFKLHPVWAICGLLGLLFFSFTAQAQSGMAFRDGNGDGTKQAGELGVPGVLVKSYINNGTGDQLLGSATTNGTGSYTLSPTAGASQKVRIEFSIPSTGCNLLNTIDFPSLGGANYGTSVQFVTGPAANVNFAILSSDFYVKDTNPAMFVPCYVNGDGPQGTTSGDDPVFVTFDYNSSGVPSSQGGSAPDPTKLVLQHQVGSTWGVAYSKLSKKTFISAFLKRHTGMGPGGSGAIYMIDPASPTAAGTTPPYFSLDALGFPTQGSGAYVATNPGFHPVIGSSVDRGLPTGKGDPSEDRSAFGQVGKVSLGGLEVSEDGRYLFVINLFDKKLYKIDLQNGKVPVLPTAASSVTQFNSSPWLTASCPNGVARPFALKYHRGKIYVGVVCTGETATYPNNSPNRFADDLRAYVYEIDPATGTGPVVLEFPLNYTKETAGNGDSSPVNGWYAWTDSWAAFIDPPYAGGGEQTHNQPIFGDIEFDVDGSLIMSFVDRGGHQGGIQNWSADGNKTGDNYIIAGDILRAWKNPNSCGYELEANGVAGPITSAAQAPLDNNGVRSGTGPGTPNGTGAAFTSYTTEGKEFYWGDAANLFGNNYPTPHHNEGAMGGLALFPSSGEVLLVGMDPVDNEAYSGGVYKLSNTTGGKSTGYNLYTATGYIGSGGFGKAAGLGDVEITGEIPPIELGNRVWKDLDQDGIQDADEPGIDGVKIQLKKGSTIVGTTTTSNGGQWYFNASNVNQNGATEVEPNTAYTICIDPTQYANKAGLGTLLGFTLTKKSITGAGDPNLSDNDADPTQNSAQISYTTGDYGQSNYNLDFGVICNTPPTNPVVTASAVTCIGTTVNSDGILTISATGAQKVAYSTGTTFTGSYSAATAYAAGILVSNLSNPASAAGQTYTVRFYGADESCFVDQTATLPFKSCVAALCSLTATATPTACNPATNQYTLNGTISLTGTAGGTVAITDGSVSTSITVAANATTANYTLTGLTSDGASHTVTVSLPGCGSAVATYNAPDRCIPTCANAYILVGEQANTGESVMIQPLVPGSSNTTNCSIPNIGGEGIAVDQTLNRAYIGSVNDPSIVVFDFAQGQLLTSIIPTSTENSYAVALSPDRLYLYRGATNTGGVERIRIADGQVVGFVPVTSTTQGTDVTRAASTPPQSEYISV